MQSEATGNWEATSGEECTIPLNFILSKVTRLRPFPFSIAGGVGYLVDQPEGGPEWKLRMAFPLTFLGAGSIFCPYG
ncbi:MAG: hypothetical protein ACREOO_03675 [bacterium]